VFVTIRLAHAPFSISERIFSPILTDDRFRRLDRDPFDLISNQASRFKALFY
jgi:hypothetical protein